MTLTIFHLTMLLCICVAAGAAVGFIIGLLNRETSPTRKVYVAKGKKLDGSSGDLLAALSELPHVGFVDLSTAEGRLKHLNLHLDQRAKRRTLH